LASRTARSASGISIEPLKKGLDPVVFDEADRRA
jgi:hypothetical protein